MLVKNREIYVSVEDVLVAFGTDTNVISSIGKWSTLIADGLLMGGATRQRWAIWPATSQLRHSYRAR